MATETRRAAPKAGPSANGRPKKASLPPVTVARFEECLRLVERVVAEKQSVFVEKANEYRETHREQTTRPLSALEAAQITAAMADHLKVGEDPGGAIADIQASGLRAYDEPDTREVLLAAGVATAPEFVNAVQRMVAVIEMEPDQFRQAREAGEEELDAAIGAAVCEMSYLDMETDARPRAVAALDHFSKAAGAGSGKGMALMAQTILKALGQAMSALPSTSSTSSLVDTGGDAQTSSTE